MAESDTILQLGIEAPREGNREEARNLFGLLTRQEPDNAQAWLWLAGVADGPEQRRAALERAVELDPTNEMAVKGLQAMGVHPTVKLDENAVPSASAATAFAAAEPERPMTDEERYAAELDSAFDDYDTVPRSETPRRDVDDRCRRQRAADQEDGERHPLMFARKTTNWTSDVKFHWRNQPVGGMGRGRKSYRTPERCPIPASSAIRGS